jgi:hypothetical protein
MLHGHFDSVLVEGLSTIAELASETLVSLGKRERAADLQRVAPHLIKPFEDALEREDRAITKLLAIAARAKASRRELSDQDLERVHQAITELREAREAERALFVRAHWEDIGVGD